MKKLLFIVLIILSFCITLSNENLSRAQTAHSVTITFTPSTSTPSGPAGLGYNLYRGTTSGGESSTPLNTTPFACSANCQFINSQNLVEGTTYFYYIKTIDITSSKLSPPSNEVSGTIPNTNIAPPVVTNIIIT